jgi:hypothetical protein
VSATCSPWAACDSQGGVLHGRASDFIFDVGLRFKQHTLYFCSLLGSESEQIKLHMKQTPVFNHMLSGLSAFEANTEEISHVFPYLQTIQLHI